MTAPVPAQLQIPPGMVCVTTYGTIQGGTMKSFMDLRSFSETNGLRNVSWDVVNGTLVEKARNDAVRLSFQRACHWLMFIDGDMVFQQDALIRMLQHAYQPNSPVDVLGGYCTLKGEYALPTIDTGTGTWESHFPGAGLVEVIRTGAAFLLIKRHVLDRMGDPWFRLRVPKRPIDAMHEVDNFARIKLDGRNPLRETEAWQKLEAAARQDPSVQSFVPAEVGEDSGFCDRAKALGFRIFVDTDTVIGHLETKIIGPQEHKTAMDNQRRQLRQLSGLLL